MNGNEVLDSMGLGGDGRKSKVDRFAADSIKRAVDVSPIPMQCPCCLGWYQLGIKTGLEIARRIDAPPVYQDTIDAMHGMMVDVNER